MTKPFDPTKPVQTRDGRKARIICTDRDHIDGPIVALVSLNTHGHEGEEGLFSYYKDGIWKPGGVEGPTDLVNIPVKKTGWVAVFKGGQDAYTTQKIYDTKEECVEKCECVLFVDAVQISWEE